MKTILKIFILFFISLELSLDCISRCIITAFKNPNLTDNVNVQERIDSANNAVSGVSEKVLFARWGLVDTYEVRDVQNLPKSNNGVNIFTYIYMVVVLFAYRIKKEFAI